jgi:hypothetical protein
MKSPHEPDGQRGEDVPSEVAEVFRPPPHRLEPPAGAYETLRRRSAGRRRRRGLAQAAAAACCAAAVVLGTYSAQSGSDVVRTRDVADAPHPTGRTAAPKAEQSPEPSAPAPGRTTAGPPASPHGSEQPASPPATTPAAPPPPAHTHRTAVSGCTTGQLTLTAGRGDAAAGSVHVPLLFTNTGPHACSMRGFPGVSLVGTGGEQIGAAASRTGSGGDAVLLAPGDSARADLRVTRAENYPQERCEPAPAKGLRVYPPNQTQALFLSRSQFTGCGNSGVGLLSVKPVRHAS